MFQLFVVSVQGHIAELCLALKLNFEEHFSSLTLLLCHHLQIFCFQNLPWEWCCKCSTTMLERTEKFLGRTSVVLGKQLWVALLEQGMGTDDLQRSLSTPATLQVCGTVQWLPLQDSSLSCESNHLLNFSVVYIVRKKIKTQNLYLVSLTLKETLDLWPWSLTMVCDRMGQLVVGDLDTAQQPTSVVLKTKSTCRKSPVGS